jgi:hypothetical protein
VRHPLCGGRQHARKGRRSERTRWPERRDGSNKCVISPCTVATNCTDRVWSAVAVAPVHLCLAPGRDRRRRQARTGAPRAGDRCRRERWSWEDLAPNSDLRVIRGAMQLVCHPERLALLPCRPADGLALHPAAPRQILRPATSRPVATTRSSGPAAGACESDGAIRTLVPDRSAPPPPTRAPRSGSRNPTFHRKRPTTCSTSSHARTPG